MGTIIFTFREDTNKENTRINEHCSVGLELEL